MLASLYTLLEQQTPGACKRIIPQTWRIWLGYQIKGRPQEPEVRLYNDAFLRPVRLPQGETYTSIYNYLAGFYIEGEGPTPEREGYLQHAFRRLLYTLDLIPGNKGRMLEVGANPYLMSLLLRRFTCYDLAYTNLIGPHELQEVEQVMVNGQGERIRFVSINYNVEAEPLPMYGEAFDVILFCEVLEHLGNDPYSALLHLKAGLKPEGHLVLTTPNVSRWESVARLMAGDNIYDIYSAYGPYGRHNREYTPEEVKRLLEHLGFVVEEMFTSDVNPAEITHLGPYLHLIEERRASLGEYTFVRACNVAPANPRRPGWLYRSYPPHEVEATNQGDPPRSAFG